MLRRALIRMALSLALLLILPLPSEADLCNNDSWGGRTATIRATATLQARLLSFTNILHFGGSTAHIFCHGDFFAKVQLLGIDASCTSMNASEHHTTLGENTIAQADRTCSIPHYNWSYHAGGTHWGFGTPEYFSESNTSIAFTPEPESCPDYCNNECPEPPDSETTDCQIVGPTDYCAYPANGCPSGEDSYNGCCFLWGTPLVLDMSGRGFKFTDLRSGVRFAIGPSDVRYRVSWTIPGSDNAWLVLDRNSNGRIDNGLEMFGNFTEQPAPRAGEQPNGFRVLSEFDLPSNGGNGDRHIDAGDGVFRSLLLWRDGNHDGLSQPSELTALATSSVSGMELEYLSAQRRDQHGNTLRYRARVHTHTAGVGPWAYDVFLKVAR